MCRELEQIYSEGMEDGEKQDDDDMDHHREQKRSGVFDFIPFVPGFHQLDHAGSSREALA